MAWASVLATTNSTPSRLELIMLLTALPPAPPTPITVIFGQRVSSSIGTLRLRSIAASAKRPLPSVPPPLACPAVLLERTPLHSAQVDQSDAWVSASISQQEGSFRLLRTGNAMPEQMPCPSGRSSSHALLPQSKILLDPVTYPTQEACRLRGLCNGCGRWHSLHREGIGQESGGRGIGRAAGRFRQSAEMNRPSDPHLLVQDQGRKIAHARKLRCAPGQNDPSSPNLVESARFQTRTYELERLLQSRLHDPHQQGAGNLLNMSFFLADLGDIDHFPLVCGSGNGMAVKRLQALGMGESRRKTARDIARDMLPTHRHHVGMDDIAFQEDSDRRGTATHVDQRHSQLALVPHQRRQTGGIRRNDEGPNAQLAALDAGREIAHGARGRRDDVHVYPKPLAVHAARVADAAAAVDGVADRNRVNELPALFGLSKYALELVTLLKRPPDVGVVHLMAIDCDLHPDEAGSGVAPREIHDDRFDRLPRHLFSSMYRGQDRAFRCFHIHHGAILDAAGQVLSHAQDLQAIRPFPPPLFDTGDQTANLAAA